MCGTNYFVPENVEQAKEVIKAEGGEKFLERIDPIIGDEAKKAAVAGIVVLVKTGGLGNVKAIATAIEAMFTAGVGFGIALSGNAYRVPPLSEEADLDREFTETFASSAAVA